MGKASRRKKESRCFQKEKYSSVAQCNTVTTLFIEEMTIARNLKRQGNYDQSYLKYKELDIKYPDDPDLLSAWAKTVASLGKFSEAISLFERAQSLYKLKGDSYYLHCEMHINELLQAEDSEDFCEYMQGISGNSAWSYPKCSEQHLNKDSVVTGIDNELLRLQVNLADEEFFERCTLMFREECQGPEHYDVAVSLNNLALLLQKRCNYGEAEPLFRRSLEILGEKLGTENPEVIGIMYNLAGILVDLGYYADAEALYRRSLATQEKVLGPEHHDVAKTLNNLANLMYKLDNFAEAASLYRRSFAILEKHKGVDLSLMAASLNNLANLSCRLGNYVEAESLYRRSHEMTEKQLVSEYSDAAHSLSNLANMMANLGNYAEAESLYRRSLSVTEKQRGPEHPYVADGLEDLAIYLCIHGNYAEAEHLHRRSLAIREKQLGAEHTNVAQSLIRLANLMAMTKRTFAAILIAKRAVNIMQKVRQNVSSISSEQLRSFDNTIESFYDILANLLIKTGRYGEAEYVMGMLKEKERFELLRRDRVIDIPKLSIGYNDAEAPLIERFDVLSASLFEHGQRQDALKKIKQPTLEQKQELVGIKQQLEEIRREFNQFLDSLNDALPPRDVTQVDKDSNFLIDLTDASPGTAAITTVTSEHTFHTVLATPYGRTAFSAEYRGEDIAKKVLRFRELLKEIDSDEYLSIAQELYDIIIRPMEKELQSGDITTLYWMLNGALRLLPLAALHDGEQFLLEKYRTISITTSSKIGAMPREQWNCLGMGVTREYAGHLALTSVKEELENIISMENTNGVIPGDILLDEQFTCEAMEEYLEDGYKAVHIASHFELNPINETLSYLLLGDGSKIRMDELSCKNRMFKGVDLVVFSACSTGLGTASTRGREVDSIGNLAETQGAKTVLATLWPVEDKSTSMLMREFYRFREGGMTIVEALQQAQLALLNGNIKSGDGHDFTHPYFWAPFILIGNGG